MNEQRLEAYLNLIQSLLSCPSEEEQTILAANQELIDLGLVQVMEQEAAMLAERGDENGAERLSRQLEYINFLFQVLRATAASGGEPREVYPLLQQNLDKLDDTFAQVLQRWAAANLLDVEPEQAQGIAAVIFNFSKLIAQFPLGNRASNLEIAITGNESALQVYTRTDFPVQWAMTQNNLGNAYSDRILQDRAQNLEAAIKCYQQALEVYTRNDFPVQWAMTQNNLGNAYSDRILQDRAQNLEAAIKCYQQALEVYTRTDFPVQWAMTQNNLGLAYWNRIRQDQAQNREAAIKCFQQALEVRTRTDFPVDWVATQNNLGTAYWNRISGDKAENLELAISCFTQALQVHTCEANPQQWAATQNNLGLAYRDLERIDEAIACFWSSLEIRTPSAFPIDCLRSGRNLGDLAFRIGRWAEAIEGYRVAIDAVEQSRTWATSESRRREILEGAIEVYQNMVQACIKNGQLEQAIEYVERSKARNLVDLLATRDLYPRGEIPKIVINELDRLRREITTRQRRLENTQQNGLEGGTRSEDGQRTLNATNVVVSQRTPLEQLQQELRDLQQQLNDLITQQIKPIDPSFSLTQQVEPINFQQIQTLLPDNQTAIIQWYITKEKFFTFIIRPGHLPIIRPSSPEDQEALFNWKNEYLRSYQQEKSQWRNQLGDQLQRLAEILHLDDILAEDILKNCQQLVLIPHRFLHLLPLHALPLPENRQKCLLDRFERGVRYAPSCQLLQLTQNQRHNFSHFFAIQNPTQNLNYTDIEVATIRRSFQPHDDVLVHQNATKKAISPERVYQTHCAHFSCHGYFNFESPLQSALLLADSEISPAPANPEPNRYLSLRDGGVIDLTKCLTLGDLFERTLDLRQCRLVTLSACETGLTDFNSLSDEYIGLPSGFLYAGSPSVVSSLWTVSDFSTAFLTIKFYQILQSPTMPIVSKALNEAQLWLRDVTKDQFLKWIHGLELDKDITEEIESDMNDCNSDVKPFENPLYWAAFCAIGQ